MSLYSFRTFIKTNASWLKGESIKTLEIKTTILINFDFSNSTTLSWFLFFFLIIDLYFLIPAVIAEISNPIAELVTPIGIPSKEAKAKTGRHPVIVESEIRKCSI